VKELLLLRHGKAQPADAGIDDHERALAERGVHDSRRMGRVLVERSMVPDAILASSAERARMTAQTVASSCNFAGTLDVTDDLYLADAIEIMAVIAGRSGTANRVLVVAHNPGLEELVEACTGKRLTLPTAALAEIELPIEDWKDLQLGVRGHVRHLWKPKSLT
jgi:phosphohistidine phosphatase